MVLDREYLKTTGRIFDIQKFSVHDGPGIRTIVFLKGCAFRCRWCCNPESQEFQVQTLHRNGKDEIMGRDVTVEEVMDEVLKDRQHFYRSGGGLTLSGGECLLQPDFASHLLLAAKLSGINTAIESTAFTKFEIIEEKILPHLDLFMMDIKHMSSAKHKLFTGKPNERVLENAKKIAESGQHLIIRVPVIPTFNATEQEIFEIAQFARSLKGVEELHLLPYHRLGIDKYTGLGRDYSLSEILPPSDEHMEQLRNVAKTTGLKVKIGG